MSSVRLKTHQAQGGGVGVGVVEGRKGVRNVVGSQGLRLARLA
jgi:hypothetical protein